ncbi:hypothetical protein [Actibacterium pelagium]|uniref:Uncharacterized protein n=1 Tax=Actibacterium pelagium TaxID=2029103 RepID=A0A917EKA3_9RHOB|nr:hypothetical protein [Actibacterium pelagium]GGE46739.1 hypothetical protein GCM10011517_13110 [Actibacterium pelagium]
MATKIATCCYCGTRAALKLVGHVQHELACSACGAPLHEIKQMPLERPVKVKPQHSYPAASVARCKKSEKKRRKKKCKSFFERDFFDFDTLEDLVDAVVDIID